MSESQAVFDVATYVVDVFYPCIAIGAVLPAGAAVLAALVRSGFKLLGLSESD